MSVCLVTSHAAAVCVCACVCVCLVTSHAAAAAAAASAAGVAAGSNTDDSVALLNPLALPVCLRGTKNMRETKRGGEKERKSMGVCVCEHV